MLGVGLAEVALVGLIVLLVFGPDGLKQAAREWGKVLAKARSGLKEAGSELTSADYPDEWFEGNSPRTQDLFDERSEE